MMLSPNTMQVKMSWHSLGTGYKLNNVGEIDTDRYIEVFKKM